MEIKTEFEAKKFQIRKKQFIEDLEATKTKKQFKEMIEFYFKIQHDYWDVE